MILMLFDFSCRSERFWTREKSFMMNYMSFYKSSTWFIFSHLTNRFCFSKFTLKHTKIKVYEVFLLPRWILNSSVKERCSLQEKMSETEPERENWELHLLFGCWSKQTLFSKESQYLFKNNIRRRLSWNIEIHSIVKSLHLKWRDD